MSLASTAAQPSLLAARRAPASSASPAWLGGLQDLQREHGFEPLRVEGRVPPALRGTLFRNGPGRFSAGGERYRHWFDADGAITAVRLEGGLAWGAARVVQTEGLKREQLAGRRLFGGYGTPLARPLREIFLQDTKNPANTSVLLWNGRLFATCEADKPYELAPGDLSTLGESRLDGVLRGPFSAHPHRVPARQAAFNFGVGHVRGASLVDVYALPDGERAQHLTRFGLDGVRTNHDFAVTANHLVFVFAPLYLSVVEMLRGRAPVGSARWKPRRGTEIVIVPIDGPAAVRRFRVDSFMLEHVVTPSKRATTSSSTTRTMRIPTGSRSSRAASRAVTWRLLCRPRSAAYASRANATRSSPVPSSSAPSSCPASRRRWKRGAIATCTPSSSARERRSRSAR